MESTTGYNITVEFVYEEDDFILYQLNREEVERQIPLLLFLCLVSLVGIPGNTLVCYIYRSKYRLSSSRWLIFFLAAVDIVTCVVGVPCEIVTSFMQYNFTNGVTCKITTFFNLWVLLCLGLTLVLIAIDRYRKVCRPLDWQITTAWAKLLCWAAVLLSLVISVPVAFMYGIYSFPLPIYDIEAYKCSLESSLSWAMYYVMFGMSMFVGALVSICVLYCLIGYEIKRHVRRSTARRNQSINSSTRFLTTRIKVTNAELQSAELSLDMSREVSEDQIHMSSGETFDDEKPQKLTFKSRRHKRQSKRIRQTRAKRATFIMFIISVVFVLSYLPFLSLLLVRSIKADFDETLSPGERAVYKFFLRSYFVSCAVNPLVYGISDPKFRKNSKEAIQNLCKTIMCSE